MDSSVKKHNISDVNLEPKSKKTKNKKRRSSSSSESDHEERRLKHKKKRRKKSDSVSDDERKKRKKHKSKKKKKSKSSRDKEEKVQQKETKINEATSDEEIGPSISEALKMKPMTKEEWEKQQSVIRRVYDPESGRNRLVKGDGEILEEIVSKERHKEINKAATFHDGEYFRKQQGLQ